MEINIQEPEQNKLNVTYVAESNEINDARSKVLEAFKKAPVKGFRPGKASLATIKIVYKDQIEDSLKRALAEDAYHNTIFDKKLRPHGAPKFNTLSLENGKFTCQFDMMTKPDFTLTDFSKLEIPKPHPISNVSDMAETMMQELRMRFGDVEPFSDDDTVKFKDNIIIDYEASSDGVRIDQLCVSGDMLTVGTTQFPEFDSYLVDMKVDETKEFSIIAPETSLPSITGKKVDFKVTLVTGSKIVPHALNDELAVKCNKASLDELRALVHASASMKVQNTEMAQLNEAISNRLIAEHDFVVPDWLALSEAQYLAQSVKLNWETIADEDKKMYINLGRKNVKLSLILDKVREDVPEAQLSEQEIFEIIKQNLMKTQEKDNIDNTIQQMNNSGQLTMLFARIKDESALTYIAKTVKIVE